MLGQKRSKRGASWNFNDIRRALMVIKCLTIQDQFRICSDFLQRNKGTNKNRAQVSNWKHQNESKQSEKWKNVSGSLHSQCSLTFSSRRKGSLIQKTRPILEEMCESDRSNGVKRRGRCETSVYTGQQLRATPSFHGRGRQSIHPPPSTSISPPSLRASLTVREGERVQGKQRGREAGETAPLFAQGQHSCQSSTLLSRGRAGSQTTVSDWKHWKLTAERVFQHCIATQLQQHFIPTNLVFRKKIMQTFVKRQPEPI